MQLNHDCVRQLLLFIEESGNYSKRLSTDSIVIDSFTPDEIVYTAERLAEADFINIRQFKAMGQTRPCYFIESITYTGHEFLDNIRDDSVWTTTKSKLSSVVKSSSLTIMSSVASQTLTAMLKNTLGI